MPDSVTPNTLPAKPKAQQRVIVTRPQAQAEAWCEHWRAQGVAALALPVLDIVPVTGEVEHQKIKAQILALDQHSILIFVSQNAVSHGWDWIDAYWPQFPVGVHCLAVGMKTQQALVERLAVHGHPMTQQIDAHSSMDSESLLDLPELQHVAGKKILIFRGCGGRTKLQDVLQARGAQAQHCELYQRCLPPQTAQQLADAQLNPEHDIVALFSGESLENFCQVVATQALPNWRQLKVVVPSQRVQQQAISLGFAHVHAAENATENAMAEAVAAWLK